MPINPPIAWLLLLTLASGSGPAQPSRPTPAKRPVAEKNVMLMNRIGPSVSELYVANADDSVEHKLLPTSGFDYHASYSADGNWLVFTPERAGLGQSDIYRVHPDGSGLEQLTNDPAFDDPASVSPDGAQLAFVSSYKALTTNVWLLDLKTRKLVNLTVFLTNQSDRLKPHSYFRRDGKGTG